MTVAAAAVSVAAESAGDSSAAAVGLMLLKSSLFFPFPDAASANDDGSVNSCLIA